MSQQSQTQRRNNNSSSNTNNNNNNTNPASQQPQQKQRPGKNTSNSNVTATPAVPPVAVTQSGIASGTKTAAPARSWNQVVAYEKQAAANVKKPATDKPQETSGEDPMHDRTLYLLASLVGLIVQVQVKDGTVFQGVFHGAQTETELGVILRMAFKTSLKNAASIVPGSYLEKFRPAPSGISKYIIIQPKDIVQITALDVDLSFGDGGILSDKTHGFRTDTAISKAAGELQERELERWVPEETVNNQLPNNEWSVIAENGKWDQFAANEKLFGIKTDFKEELYTTKLDKGSDLYIKREKEAERLAKEIERASTGNVHLAEERGHIIDDSVMNEEDRYGAVVRGPNTYVPPNMRKSANVAAQKKSDIQQPAEKANVDTATSPKVEKHSIADKIAKSPEFVVTERRKSALNPNASSFSFNIGAVEFQPSFSSGSAPAPVSKPEIKILLQPDPIFGRQIRKLEGPLRLLFGKSLFGPTKTDISRFTTKWPYGQISFKQLIYSTDTFFLDQAQVPYGFQYGYQPYSTFPGQPVPGAFYQAPAIPGGFVPPPPPQQYISPVPRFSSMGVPPPSFPFQQFVPLPMSPQQYLAAENGASGGEE